MSIATVAMVVSVAATVGNLAVLWWMWNGRPVQLRNSKPAPLMDEWDISPDQVCDDDENRRRIVAAALNHRGMVFGKVDEDGNLTMTDEHGNLIGVMVIGRDLEMLDALMPFSREEIRRIDQREADRN